MTTTTKKATTPTTVTTSTTSTSTTMSPLPPHNHHHHLHKHHWLWHFQAVHTQCDWLLASEIHHNTTATTTTTTTTTACHVHTFTSQPSQSPQHAYATAAVPEKWCHHFWTLQPFEIPSHTYLLSYTEWEQAEDSYVEWVGADRDRICFKTSTFLPQICS